jgi:hypothetical protein
MCSKSIWNFTLPNFLLPRKLQREMFPRVQISSPTSSRKKNTKRNSVSVKILLEL